MHSQVTQVYFRLLLCLCYFVGRDKATVGNTSVYSCQARELGLNKNVVPSDRHRLKMFLVVKAFEQTLKLQNLGFIRSLMSICFSGAYTKNCWCFGFWVKQTELADLTKMVRVSIKCQQRRISTQSRRTCGRKSLQISCVSPFTV